MKVNTWCKKVSVFGSAFALFLAAGAALSDPIGPDCDSCLGNVYQLEYTVVGNNEIQVTLTIDTTDTILTEDQFLAQVAFKVTSSSDDITGATLVSTNALGTWETLVGGLNNNGCKEGEQGFICSTDGTENLITGQTFTFVYDVFVTSLDQLLLTDFGASIKANFGPDNGFITSEAITLQPGAEAPPDVPLPEPATLALIGIGLAGIGLRMRRARPIH